MIIFFSYGFGMRNMFIWKNTGPGNLIKIITKIINGCTHPLIHHFISKIISGYILAYFRYH